MKSAFFSVFFTAFLPGILTAALVARPAIAGAEATATSKTGASTALAGITAPELLKLVATSDARATVVNVWASWCTPCERELPALLALPREYSGKGVRLILVSADGGGTPANGEKAAREFLARFAQQLSPEIHRYLLGEAPEVFVKGLEPSWTPSVPATFFYDGQGKLRSFKVGQISKEELRKRIQSILNHEDMPRSR